MEVALLACLSIKKKLVLCVVLIGVIVITLTISGMISVYAYRDVVRTLRFRAREFPYAHQLAQSVEQLAATFHRIPQHRNPNPVTAAPFEPFATRAAFRLQLSQVVDDLIHYRAQLRHIEPGSGISDNRIELNAAERIEYSLSTISRLTPNEDWVLDQVDFDALGEEIGVLQLLAADLPKHLQRKMGDLQGNVRGRYQTLIGLTATSSVLSVLLLAWLVKFFYDGVVCPLRTVIRGSRRVAAGDFDHRVELHTHDEMAELAAALNAMTSRFKEIRDDLDRQVRDRTREVVRSEQLASVGFLAAGVSHEINNPLQAIAMCAESLETRLQDIIAEDDEKSDDDHNTEITVLRKYLRRIQDEAFRCKGITDKLLSYSRLGDAEKVNTDLNEVVTDVIELIRTISAYRGKRIEFHSNGPLIARVVPHEIKQVVLNLLTNALDSLDANGRVNLELNRSGTLAELIVRDDGCGMTKEVQKHLFEPFFTRRRNGQGTGLGLSITYRIVQDHGGAIAASSDGPGRGSQFRITLPLDHHEERTQELQAA